LPEIARDRKNNDCKIISIEGIVELKVERGNKKYEKTTIIVTNQ
jgi:hypothetical protein